MRNDASIAMRTKYAYREAAVSISGNIALAVAKILVGMVVTSMALIADGVHSLSDVGTSLVVVVGAKASEKEPDEEHPFGHGRYEYIASLIIYLALIAVGMELMVNSVDRALRGSSPNLGDLSIPVYAVIVAGIVVKELMARYSFHLAERTDSEMLRGDGWHHRSDALTTVGVLIGILLVQLGLPLADALIGLFISAFIIVTGARMAYGTSVVLAGKSAPPEKIEEIRNAAMSVRGVLGAHSIFVHDYGHSKVVTMHVEVDSRMGTGYAHSIASEVEKAVKNVVDGDVVVHTEPAKSTPSEEVEKELERILRENEHVREYHNISSYYDEKGGHVSAHIKVDRNMSVEESHRLEHEIDSRLKERYPDYRVELHIEPE